MKTRYFSLTGTWYSAALGVIFFHAQDISNIGTMGFPVINGTHKTQDKVYQ